MTKIPININAGWMPDYNLEEIAKLGGLKTAKNVIPTNKKYKPLQGLLTFNATAVTGTALNGYVVQDIDGLYYNFLGTTTKLYRYSSSALTDVTRTASNYDGSYWNFTEYGTWLIATNFVDVVQVLKGFTTANFVALGGTPPIAKYCLLNNGHLILAGLNESGTNKPKKVKWSARDSLEDWTASLLTGAGEKEFAEMLGGITGIGSIGDNFIIATENGITIGYYVGGVYTFSFKINAYKNIGCFYPQSFISVRDFILFWGKDDIYLFDGTTMKPIGEKVRNTILSDINPTYINRISTLHDKKNKTIIWSYPSLTSNGTPDKLVFYNYQEDRWSHADLSVQCLIVSVSGGILIEDLASTDLDSIAIPIDSDYWLGKNILPAAVDTDSKIKTFSGASLEAEIETGEYFESPLMLQINKAYLPIDTLIGSSTVNVLHRNSAAAGQTAASTVNVKTDGSVDLRTTNKRLALRIKVLSYISIGNTIETEITTTGKK